MEYTIKTLAKISGVSTRTLRYYDEIGLLKPCRINSSGYRIYGEQEIDILQQILFYRELDLKLEQIKHIMQQEDFNIDRALDEHYKNLLKRREHIDQLLSTVKMTMDSRKEGRSMTEQEKFEVFKQEKLAKNEEQYGTEIRERYGEDVVKASNDHFMKLSEEDFQKMKQTEEDMFAALIEVQRTKDLTSKAASTVYEKHKEWLSFTWNFYTKEAHANLAQMYVNDERFTSYYEERAGKGAAKLLCDIITEHTK